MDEFYVHSRTSRCLGTCRWTVKVTCWSLTASIIAFYCWTVNYNYNASSSTATLQSRCGGQTDCGTTNWRHNSTLFAAAAAVGGFLTSSRYSLYAKWLTHHCSIPTLCTNVPVWYVWVSLNTTIDLTLCNVLKRILLLLAKYIKGNISTFTHKSVATTSISYKEIAIWQCFKGDFWPYFHRVCIEMACISFLFDLIT